MIKDKSKPKEIWSDNYGTNPDEGVQKYLEKMIPGYQRKNVGDVVNPFLKQLGLAENADLKIVSRNFSAFTKYVKEYLKKS